MLGIDTEIYSIRRIGCAWWCDFVLFVRCRKHLVWVFVTMIILAGFSAVLFTLHAGSNLGIDDAGLIWGWSIVVCHPVLYYAWHCICFQSIFSKFGWFWSSRIHLHWGSSIKHGTRTKAQCNLSRKGSVSKYVTFQSHRDRGIVGKLVMCNMSHGRALGLHPKQQLTSRTSNKAF